MAIKAYFETFFVVEENKPEQFWARHCCYEEERSQPILE